MLEWEWWHDHNTSRLFLAILLKANHKPKRWKGMVIERGQLVTGRRALSDLTGLSLQSVRTSLLHLKSTNEITIKSTSKFSIITICKYDDYQRDINQTNHQINQQPNQQLTSNQPATNHKQELKKERIKEDIIRPKKNPPGWREGTECIADFCYFKPEELGRLEAKFSKKIVEAKIKSLAVNIENGVKKYLNYKNHYRVVDTWITNDLANGKITLKGLRG